MITKQQILDTINDLKFRVIDLEMKMKKQESKEVTGGINMNLVNELGKRGVVKKVGKKVIVTCKNGEEIQVELKEIQELMRG